MNSENKAGRLSLGSLVLILLLPVSAGGSIDRERALAGQRQSFLDAEKALRKNQLNRFKQLKSTLTDYPLLPYLEYAEIKRHLSTAQAHDIREFLRRNANTPLAKLMRGAWLRHLAKQKNWRPFLAFYQPSTSTALRCNYLTALIHTGQNDYALSQVKPLWLSGKSQPKECDYPFAVWRDAGKLAPDLIWKRIQLAMDQKQIRLARYLRRYLAPADKTWLDRWLKIHKNPASVHTTLFAQQRHPMRKKIIVYALKRLAYRDPEQTIQLWRQFGSDNSFTLEEQVAVERAIAMALVRNEDIDVIDYLERIQPCENDIPLHEARIRAALLRRDWDTALAWLETFPKREQMPERWRYWQGRALAELGHQTEAIELFDRLAKERSYYGFLAADRLGREYNLNHSALTITERELNELRDRPGMRRAFELLNLDRKIEARREWESVMAELEPRQLRVAAKLAHNWEWHDRAIFALARTGYWDDLELRFPTEYRASIEKQANHRQLDSAWIFAVVRQESAFMQDARSGAGALGLMQLMPSTARSVARKLSTRAPTRKDLLQPALNIRLGTAYLRTVLDDFEQHPVLASAAYNAGPGRVRKWIPDDSMPADLWIETIPFRETRGYVRRVMAYTVIYEQRLGQEPTPLKKRLRPITGRLLAAGSEPAKQYRGHSG